MPEICAECGAVFEDNEICQTLFDALLVLEFSDPAYGEVHFLTVACFMIQHGRYSDEGLAWIERVMRRYLAEGLSSEQLRKIAAEDTGSDQRTWKVARPADAAPPPRVAWKMTIQDVAEGYQDAQSYRDLVRQWAVQTLDQMTPG
jgi:hypothetical protein